MSKKSDERSTPQLLFDKLNAEFHFDIDLAASDENHKLPRYYTKQNSAFKYKWTARCFLNPPYSEIYKWLEYANRQTGLIVCVLPCDTSTRWFHDFIWNDQIQMTKTRVRLRFPRGRFKFGSYDTSPRFATMIVIFLPCP